jgi:Uma2 family endonuclease
MVLRFTAHEDAIAPFLEERRRTGGDRWDEVWQAVLHIVPSPTEEHQRLGTKLLVVTDPLAEARGLRAAYELSLFQPGEWEKDYRNPDLVYYRPPVGPRLVTAELVVEILSPGDETYEKLPFYRARGVKEVLVLDPRTRLPELHFADGATAKGLVRSAVLGVTFEAVAGPLLRIAWDGGEARI